MSEGAAASFFAKKKKKKAFTLNANWVDADTVTSTTHVDAPALSTDVAPITVESLLSEPVSTMASTAEGGEGEWDDAAVVTLSGTTTLLGAAKGASSAAVATLELGTLSSAATSSQAEDSIAEKLAVEETRAALAAARLGMERQAAAAATQAEPTPVAKPADTSGGKYIPAHLRKSAVSTSTAFNVASNELFPDLHQAEQMAAAKSKPKIAKPKAPWGPKPTTTSKAAEVVAPSNNPAAVVAEPTLKEAIVAPVPEAAEATTTETVSSSEAPAATSSSSSSTPIIPKTTTTKKKKKDLSTFKVASATS